MWNAPNGFFDSSVPSAPADVHEISSPAVVCSIKLPTFLPVQFLSEALSGNTAGNADAANDNTPALSADSAIAVKPRSFTLLNITALP
jgi:hypothetical protein